VKRVFVSVLTLGTIATLSAITFASASENPEEPSYGLTVEPICKAYVGSYKHRHLPRLRGGISLLTRSATVFADEGKNLNSTIDQLIAVPQPETREPSIAKWIYYLRTMVSLFDRTSKALRAGNEPKARQMLTQLSRHASFANAVILSLGFHSCKLNPSRFS
jgi:hypothetical protein